jgi:hypothetical protein
MTTLRHLGSLALFALTGATLIGCAGSADAEEDGQAGASEVVTARCPQEFKLAFERPTLFWRSIEADWQGDPNYRETLLRKMRATRDRGAFEAEFTHRDREPARCVYGTAADAELVNTWFETKGGRDQLRIFQEGAIYYVSVASYDREGLTLPAAVDTPIYASVPIHDADDYVRVGTVRVRLVP